MKITNILVGLIVMVILLSGCTQQETIQTSPSPELKDNATNADAKSNLGNGTQAAVDKPTPTGQGVIEGVKTKINKVYQTTKIDEYDAETKSICAGKPKDNFKFIIAEMSFENILANKSCLYLFKVQDEEGRNFNTAEVGYMVPGNDCFAFGVPGCLDPTETKNKKVGFEVPMQVKKVKIFYGATLLGTYEVG